MYSEKNMCMGGVLMKQDWRWVGNFELNNAYMSLYYLFSLPLCLFLKLEINQEGAWRSFFLLNSSQCWIAWDGPLSSLILALTPSSTVLSKQGRKSSGRTSDVLELLIERAAGYVIAVRVRSHLDKCQLGTRWFWWIFHVNGSSF